MAIYDGALVSLWCEVCRGGGWSGRGNDCGGGCLVSACLPNGTWIAFLHTRTDRRDAGDPNSTISSLFDTTHIY